MSSVRVLPNRNTVGLLALLVAMWYAGASQNNGAAYLLCFVLAGVALVSILHSWRNLRGLRLSCGPAAPVFAGERQRVSAGVLAAPGRTHAAVHLRARGRGEAAFFPEVSGPQWRRGDVWIATQRRGLFEETVLTVSSLYPLGFFSARMVVALPQPRWVYPKAEGARPLPRTPVSGTPHGAGARAEGDDFAGVRAYAPGEPQRHIDWKAVARGQPLVIKQWAGGADETVHLRWEDTAGLAHEARLSQLARWILTVEHAGRNYALSLPGTTIAASRGEAHFHECLRALALFPAEPPA